jgi:hypothetical protein
MEGREALMDRARATVPTRHDTTRHDTTRHDTTRHDTTRHDTTNNADLCQIANLTLDEQYKGYKRKIAQALKMYDKATEYELKKKHIDRISARYTAQFLKTQGTDDRLRQASAWYATDLSL